MRDFPFVAAIFDLDGTLFDSLGVWAHVDEVFFERRGIALPADYGAALSGLSYMEAAEYTRARFHLPESSAEIWAEWSAIALGDYANHVRLKDGAAQYLRALRRAGIRLGVATMLPEHLYAPCLKRHGLYELFDALCSTHGGSDRGKADGALFREAAERLGVAPAQCVAFDDVLEGVVGAKAAGMHAICVQEAYSAHASPERAADGVISRWSEAPLPPAAQSPARCAIFTARCDGGVRSAYAPREGDYRLAADGGYRLLREAGLDCDELLGDFDSMPAPQDAGAPVARFPVEKDDTDTLLCVKRALALGYDEICIVGGTGGRLDHTLANVQTLAYAAEKHARAALDDGQIWMTVLANGEIEIPRRPGKLSVFALSERATGVTLSGVRYPLEGGTLRNAYPLGVSNEFTQPCARIRVDAGMLLIVAGARDED